VYQSAVGQWRSANRFCRANDGESRFARENLQNFIDTLLILPQYLVLRELPILRVGLVISSWKTGPLFNLSPREIVPGGTSMATKKKAKKKKKH
jgi:hypothetical protein